MEKENEKPSNDEKEQKEENDEQNDKDNGDVSNELSLRPSVRLTKQQAKDLEEEFQRLIRSGTKLSKNDILIRGIYAKMGTHERSYQAIKAEGLVKLRNWNPEMTCQKCGRVIQVSEEILYKKEYGAVCLICQKETEQATMTDSATLINQITIAGQEKKIRETAKILRDMYRTIYDCGENIHLPEYASLLLEATKNENAVLKAFLMLIREPNLVPDKGAARIYLEEAEKHKQCRISLERKRREIELKPITPARIKETLQGLEYYVPVEVQPPQIEDKRSDEQRETTDVLPAESAQVKEKPSETGWKMMDPTNIQYAEAGMDYCKARSEWMWADPKRCADCKEKNPSLYDECLKWNQEARQKLSSGHPESEGKP